MSARELGHHPVVEDDRRGPAATVDHAVDDGVHPGSSATASSIDPK